MRWILLSLIICGCSSNKINVEVNHPLLGEIYSNFTIEAKKRGVKLPNDFHLSIIADETMSNFVYGHCILLNEGKTRLIRINRYKNIDYYQLEEIVFHELGHCVLDRMHCPDLDSLGNPSSIMVREGFVKYYEINREKFLDELFDGGS
jgi:hypothetical protein